MHRSRHTERQPSMPSLSDESFPSPFPVLNGLRNILSNPEKTYHWDHTKDQIGTYNLTFFIIHYCRHRNMKLGVNFVRSCDQENLCEPQQFLQRLWYNPVVLGFHEHMNRMICIKYLPTKDINCISEFKREKLTQCPYGIATNSGFQNQRWTVIEPAFSK